MKYIVLHRFEEEHDMILINIDHISAIEPMEEDKRHSTVFINAISSVDVEESIDTITRVIDKIERPVKSE